VLNSVLDTNSHKYFNHQAQFFQPPRVGRLNEFYGENHNANSSKSILTDLNHHREQQGVGGFIQATSFNLGTIN